MVVQSFAFTANNSIYAALGDTMNNWKFFPKPDAAWGRIPVWDFADVLESACGGVAAGGRFYGYHPMNSLTVLLPTV